jgi:hypothetical protein
MSPSPPRRRWLILGCSGVVVLVTATAVGLFTTHRVWRGRRQAQQRAAAVKVEALGGWVQHSFSSASPLAIWLENGDAPNVFSLDDRGITDEDLGLFENAPATRGLYLFNNRLSDKGLMHLADLHELETLDLRRNVAITDAGLGHLANLKNIKHLYLMGTSVTPDGVQTLQVKLPGAKIYHSAARPD